MDILGLTHSELHDWGNNNFKGTRGIWEATELSGFRKGLRGDFFPDRTASRSHFPALWQEGAISESP